MWPCSQRPQRRRARKNLLFGCELYLRLISGTFTTCVSFGGKNSPANQAAFPYDSYRAFTLDVMLFKVHFHTYIVIVYICKTPYNSPHKDVGQSVCPAAPPDVDALQCQVTEGACVIKVRKRIPTSNVTGCMVQRRAPICIGAPKCKPRPRHLCSRGVSSRCGTSLLRQLLKPFP